MPLPYHTASRPPAPARGGSHDFGESHLDVSHLTRLLEDHPLAQAVTWRSWHPLSFLVPLVYRRQPGSCLTHDSARRHIRHSCHKEPRVEEKPGVTRELRSLAKSNMAAESKTRRRAVAMVVAAVLAVCVWAVVHFLL